MLLVFFKTARHLEEAPDVYVKSHSKLPQRSTEQLHPTCPTRGLKGRFMTARLFNGSTLELPRHPSTKRYGLLV